MDQAHLIDMVTKELMRRLGLTADGSKTPQEKPFLVAGKGDSLPEAMRELHAEYYDPAGCRPDFERYAGVVIPSLSVNQLVLASFGMKYVCPEAGCGEESALMVDALLAGAPVYVIEEGIAWRCAARPESPLGRHYAACEEKIRSFGAKFVPAAELAKCATGCDAPKSSAEVETFSAAKGCAKGLPAVELLSKKVLSEREVQEACAGGCGEVLVDAKAIVTPLAMDWLRLRGISVRRAGEGTK